MRQGPRPELEKHFTASALVLGADRSLLLVDHRKLGVWLYPGGHLNPGETPDQAVVREVREETGLDVELLGPTHDTLSDPQSDVWALHDPYRILVELIDDPKGRHYHIDLVYLCGITGGGVVVLGQQANDEVRDAGFFTRDQAMQLVLFPSFCKLLDEVFADPDVWALHDRRQLAP